MTIRYFKKVDVAGHTRGLLRVVEEPGSHREEVWTGAAWQPTSMVMGAMLGGDGLVDQTTEDEGRTLYPKAFA